MNLVTNKILNEKERRQIIENISAFESRHSLLSRAKIAALLDYAPGSKSLNDIMSSSDFPAPVILKIGGLPRWKCGDVLDWINKRQQAI